MAPAPTEESVTNTPSRSPVKVVSVAVHHGAGSACRVAVSRRSHRCDRTQTAVMTRAMPKAVVIRGGEALPSPVRGFLVYVMAGRQRFAADILGALPPDGEPIGKPFADAAGLSPQHQDRHRP